MKFSAFGLLGLSLIAIRAHAAPVGMAASVKGNVTVAEDGKKIPLKLLGRLEPGVTINSGPNSSAIIVLFKDGARFQIGANKSAKVSATSVTGAQKLGGLSGPSAGAVKLLADARVGAIMARPAAIFRRLAADSPPYYETPTPRFDWEPEAGAEKYTFTLFDETDNVIWSTSTSQTGVTYPDDAPPLLEKHPYVWKLSTFKQSGKPAKGYWGIITVLSSQDARELDSVVTKLKADAATDTEDDTALLLLAETYRYYGVLNGTLEVLTEFPLNGKPGVEEATEAIKDSMSPFTRALAGRPLPANAYGAP